MNKQNRNKLLSKYITEFQEHLVEEELHERDTQKGKKVYRKLETKDDVMKILSETYLKEYKETEKEIVDDVFKTKTDVKNLKVKKRRLDTKTKEYEKELKSLKRDLGKLMTKINKLEDKVWKRNSESKELDKEIKSKRKHYQNKELELKTDILGDGTDDDYYMNWFWVFIELQQLFDGKKITLTSMDTYPKYRVRFFGGKGTKKSPRGGFEIHGRVGKSDWDDLKKRLKRTPKNKDVLPLILPKLKIQLRHYFTSDKFKTYLRQKTKPIGSGYGVYKRMK